MSASRTQEAEIRALVEDRVKAVRAKDVGAATSRVATDTVTFDVVNPLHRVGTEQLRRRAEEWFSSFDGPIGVQMRDHVVAAGDDVGYSHSLVRYSGTRSDGRTLDMWVRMTVCYRRIDGTWTIVHEHSSVPFDPESGKASLDLKP